MTAIIMRRASGICIRPYFLSRASITSLPVLLVFLWLAYTGVCAAQTNINPPASPVRLCFIHHSTGEGWLREDAGGLITGLNANKYHVHDTNYDWGPYDEDVNNGNNIGTHTDIGHWYNWFLGPHRNTYLKALYENSALSDGMMYGDSCADPGGENTVIMFKSCFTSAQTIYGEPTDAPLAKGLTNPLKGVGVEVDTAYTVANIKALYRDLRDYFATRNDKLFVLITTPPTCQDQADDAMPKLRAINRWLVEHALDGYPLNNFAVFDYYNVLTSNGGNPNTNDIGSMSGSHHRYRNGHVEYIIGSSNFLAYGTYDASSSSWDNHPTNAGHQKAAAEFIPLLNIAYNRWKGITSVDRTVHAQPDEIVLDEIYPNPVRGTGIARVHLGSPATLTIDLQDCLGRTVRTMLEGKLEAGSHTVSIPTDGLPAGVYHCTARSERASQCRRIVVR
jgi:hypothetical protein